MCFELHEVITLYIFCYVTCRLEPSKYTYILTPTCCIFMQTDASYISDQVKMTIIFSIS